MVEKFDSGAEAVAIADPAFAAIRETLLAEGKPVHECPTYKSADEMLKSEELDAVMVGTRCSLHSQMGVKVIEKGLPLYLEKPVATNRADLEALAAAEHRATAPVVVSFPLRVSPMVQTAKDIIESGKIGSVEDAVAWCDPTYGGVYFFRWFRDEKETGGLWLQKATHDFDYLTHLVDSPARRIAAMSTKRVFTGDKPAGLHCADCDEWESCMESPFHLYYSRGEAESVKPIAERMCVFAEDTGNMDAGHAIVEFESGVVASYSQNFVVRREAGRRGARIYGYRGTIEFDWTSDELKVFMHHEPKVETHKFDSAALSHAGGDNVLIWNFLECVRGRAESLSPLAAGIESANLCLAARESCESGAFVELPAL
jgi:predicted dehydrogenase